MYVSFFVGSFDRMERLVLGDSNESRRSYYKLAGLNRKVKFVYVCMYVCMYVYVYAM